MDLDFKIIYSKNKELQDLAKLIEPLIINCDILLGFSEPATIKVGNYLFQDQNEGGWTYNLDEIVVLSNTDDPDDFAKWPILEVKNPETLFSLTGTLTLVDCFNTEYHVDMEIL